MQIRTFYQPCVTGTTQTPSCNCGTAIRSGDDVIVFRGCRPGEGISVDMFVNGELETGTRVLRNKGGQEYKVCCDDILYNMIYVFNICAMTLYNNN